MSLSTPSLDGRPRALRLEILARCVLVATLLLLSKQASAVVDPSCKPLVNALEKQLNTPSHTFTTGTKGPKDPTVAETIYTSTAVYFNLNGKWQRSRLSLEDWRKMRRESVQNGTMSCKYLRDETTNGEAAAVYSSRQVMEGTNVDSLVWISKGRGLPLRAETDMDVAGGKAGKTHTATTYKYGNVQAPAGVQ